VLELAVKGMLPKNKTRLHRLKRLKLHVWAEHAYAQQLMQSEQLKDKTFAELNK
jgi:ribosomal protein L13